jgi:hypothetical protein
MQMSNPRVLTRNSPSSSNIQKKEEQEEVTWDYTYREHYGSSMCGPAIAQWDQGWDGPKTLVLLLQQQLSTVVLPWTSLWPGHSICRNRSTTYFLQHYYLLCTVKLCARKGWHHKHCISTLPNMSHGLF